MKTKKKRRRIARLVLPLGAVAVIVGILMSNGCAKSYANRDPMGEVFPTVTGQSLEKNATEIPSAYSGAPVIVLVGYKQSAQFDIDRWLMGLMQAEVDAAIVEVPTIPALVPTMISGWIDDGMRAGIPKEDWGAVVTLYGKAAEPIARLTGNESGQLTRVLVLDAEGKIVWFDDTGYAARKALEIADLVGQLQGL